MSIELNHLIVHCRDKKVSAKFLVDILGLARPFAFGPFLAVKLANGVTMDFMETDEDVHWGHYAFLVSEKEFDSSFARITARGLDYWADPEKRRKGKISTNNGGRRIYFEDPDGHFLEILTTRYGGD